MFTGRTTIGLALVSCLILVASCGLLSPHHKAVTTDALEPFECGTIEKLHTQGGIFLASQPGREDLEKAKEGGIRAVLNLRKPEEIDWDEKAVVEDLGMEYHNIPFSSPGELTDEVFDEALALMKEKKNLPMLVHCKSANRVGAIWLAHRVLNDGVDVEKATEEARTVGLKLPALEEKARAYIEEKKG